MENVRGRGENKCKGPKLGRAGRLVQIEQPGPGEGRLRDEVRVVSRGQVRQFLWGLAFRPS